jgi:hypothetical protein
MSQPICFDFFKLPQELRDLVYYYLWQGSPNLVVPYLGKKSLIRYGGSNQPYAESLDMLSTRTEVLPHWLFINKAFYDESVTLLTKHAEWIRVPYGDYHPNAGSSTLFGPQSAQIVTLMLSEYGRSTMFPFRITSSSASAHHDVVSHNRIAEDMASSGKPRSLHLWFELKEEGPPAQFEPFVDMNFEFLEPFQYANIATLAIYAYGEDLTLRASIPLERLERLQAGMRRIAGIVFGEQDSEVEREQHWEDIKTLTRFHWYLFSRTLLP